MYREPSVVTLSNLENKKSMFGSKDMHDHKDSVVNSEKMLKVNKYPHFKKRRKCFNSHGI